MNTLSIDLFSSLQPELSILILLCWGFGLIIKTSSIPNKYIPLILSLSSIFMAALYIIATNGQDNILMNIFMSITQGVVYWLIAWVSYEKCIKVLIKKFNFSLDELNIDLTGLDDETEEIEDEIPECDENNIE